MDWLFDLWANGQWYERVYIVSVFLLILSILLFLPFSFAYSEVYDEIQREFDKLSTFQFFLNFRKRKRDQLYWKARSIVSSRNSKYKYYRFGGFLGSIASICFVVSFWFFSGSLVYEKVIVKLTDSSPDTSEEQNYDYDDSGDYDDAGNFEGDDNIHHVDPHWVDDYTRSDGTEVDGYYRGGDDGYDRSDPDGDTSNNLDSDGGIFDSLFGN